MDDDTWNDRERDSPDEWAILANGFYPLRSDPDSICGLVCHVGSYKSKL